MHLSLSPSPSFWCCCTRNNYSSTEQQLGRRTGTEMLDTRAHFLARLPRRALRRFQGTQDSSFWSSTPSPVLSIGSNERCTVTAEHAGEPKTKRVLAYVVMHPRTRLIYPPARCLGLFPSFVPLEFLYHFELCFERRI